MVKGSEKRLAKCSDTSNEIRRQPRSTRATIRRTSRKLLRHFQSIQWWPRSNSVAIRKISAKVLGSFQSNTIVTPIHLHNNLGNVLQSPATLPIKFDNNPDPLTQQSKKTSYKVLWYFQSNTVTTRSNSVTVRQTSRAVLQYFKPSSVTTPIELRNNP